MASIVGSIKNWARERFTDPAPTDRHLNITFIPIYRGGDENKKLVGMFVPELYELAITPGAGEGLRCQIERDEWVAARKIKEVNFDLNTPAGKLKFKAKKPGLYAKLYRTDDEPKTPFELAMVATKSADVVGHTMVKEYRFRHQKHLPLPGFVSKFRVGHDYLANIQKAGLTAGAPLVKANMNLLEKFGYYANNAIKWLKMHAGLYSGPIGHNHQITVENPVKQQTLREEILHYAGSWIAWVSTFCTAIAMTEGATLLGITMTGPFAIGGIVLAMYLANKCGKDFGLFDLAENLHRDIGLLFSKGLGFSKNSKINWLKLAETTLYLAAVGVAACFGAAEMWSFVAKLPVTSLLSLGLSAGVASVVQTGLAAVIAATTALGVYAGGASAQRYFWGLSIYDRQIDFKPEMGTEEVLPAVNVEKTREASFDRKLQALIDKFTQDKYGFEPDDFKGVAKQFKSLKKHLRVEKVAANDAPVLVKRRIIFQTNR